MQYEIRALSWSEILDTSFRILRNHFGLLVGIAASVYVPMGMLGMGFASLVERGPGERSLLVLAGVILAVAILVTTAATLVFAAITWAIAELYCGRTVTWQQALARGQRHFARLLGTTILSSIFALLGFAFLIVPGVYLVLCWVVLWPVMLIERRFGTRALGRSRELMRGNLLRALGLLLVVWLVSAVLSTGLALPVAAFPMLQSVVSGAVNAVTSAYGAAVAVVLYFDVRCRKEAFDLTHLAELVSAASADRAPA